MSKFKKGDIVQMNPIWMEDCAKQLTTDPFLCKSSDTQYKITSTYIANITLKPIEDQPTSGSDGLEIDTISRSLVITWGGKDCTIDDMFIFPNEKPISNSTYPDTCICGSPALLMFNLFECTNSNCINHKR